MNTKKITHLLASTFLEQSSSNASYHHWCFKHTTIMTSVPNFPAEWTGFSCWHRALNAAHGKQTMLSVHHSCTAPSPCPMPGTDLLPPASSPAPHSGASRAQPMPTREKDYSCHVWYPSRQTLCFNVKKLGSLGRCSRCQSLLDHKWLINPKWKFLYGFKKK